MTFVSYLIVFASCVLVLSVILITRPKGVGDKARGVALALMAGGIAGNMYFISAGLGLLRTSADTGDWSAWATWIPYPVLLGGILVAVTNIPFMTKALQEYEAIFVVTLFEGSHITVACVSGTWVLGELDGQPTAQSIVYFVCVLIIVAGLLVIQSTAAGADKTPRFENRPLSDMRSLNRGFRAMPPPNKGPEEVGAGDRMAPPTQASNHTTQTSCVSHDNGVVLWAGSLSGIGSATFASPQESESGDTSDETSDTCPEDGDDDNASVIAELDDFQSGRA
eukprot:CAMPEP_0170213904 /NCGR_PEP_ID=MMETSP0116_2-20130129/6578_1 /TAXON_ID=400756 /ORGANISM="Durinskia baltica, Strain CSIRO CS-38" /LENGTH=279 /DNA_ID=CAMNT_0010464459 /DNA_START=353 /DNA_END=1190 /DNA_ORIENTATION=-